MSSPDQLNFSGPIPSDEFLSSLGSGPAADALRAAHAMNLLTSAYKFTVGGEQTLQNVEAAASLVEDLKKQHEL